MIKNTIKNLFLFTKKSFNMFQALKTDEFINLFDKIANIPYNYGEILNNSCCDVSKDNKLAIGTKKCLILFNLNVDMNKINMNMNSKFNLNDAFLANVISKPKLKSEFLNDSIINVFKLGVLVLFKYSLKLCSRVTLNLLHMS